MMFMQMAEIAAQRSTCQRAAVGCIITDLSGTSIVSIGYNGNARGLPNHCDTANPGECGCIHAEANALIKAPFHQGALTMYSTTQPCIDCAKLIINSAVRTVIFKDLYRDPRGHVAMSQAGIRVERLANEPREQLELV